MDEGSRAEKISSARQLLKKYQKRKAAEPSITPEPQQFTPLVEPEQALSYTAKPDQEPVSSPAISSPAGSAEHAIVDAASRLPVFTFPEDTGGSFSKYLGVSAVSPATSASAPTSGAPTAVPATEASSSQASPAGVDSDPRLVAPPDPGHDLPPAAAPDSDAPVAVLSKDSPAVLGDSEHSPDLVSEVTAAVTGAVADVGSMSSSFTFASQVGTGSGSESHSATSSRTSDWEYVGGPQEAAKPQSVVPEDAVPTHLTSETLRQLSDRLSQMTVDTDAGDGGTSSAAALALEQRNAELAAQLESERSLRTVADQQAQELRERISELESSGEAAVRATEQRLQQQQHALEEQARAQAQTIGILVAEKTELSAEAGRMQTRLQQKTEECEATGSRLAAAEATTSQLQEQISRADQTQVSVQHLQSLYAEADNERNRNRELCQELREELDEARQRLRSQLDANQLLTRQLSDVSGRLELAEIRVTQLSSCDGSQSEASAAASVAAEAARAQAERSAEQARAERDAAAVQFQQYSASLTSRLAEAERQRDELVARLAAAAVQPPAAAAETTAPPANDAEREELRTLREQKQQHSAEVEALTQQLRVLGEDNTRLSLSGQQMAATLKDMEVTVERANSSTVDQDQLAKEMESDRVAASRAVAQNKQLKQQLEELQNGFITLSNKKLELTESLEREQRAGAERQGQLQQLQAELERTAAQAIDAEQRHMSAQQMVDQLRHYEAVGRQAEVLQTELSAAQEQLRRHQTASSEPDAREALVPGDLHLSTAAGSDPEDRAGHSSTAGEESALSEGTESRASSPSGRASSPSGRARPPVEEVIREREELRARLQQFIGGGAVDPAEHEKLRSALAQLEVRFCDVMNQVAVLREERQGLEHLCEQLQGETDTIGEYISLYQVQRSALKQQAVERQQELATLHEDRQQLRQQLHQLQQLVSQLMSSRPATPASLSPDGGTERPELEVAELATTLSTVPTAAAVSSPSGADTPPSPPSPVDGDADPVPAREDTARRIISLIEQIGANEYVEGHSAPLHVCQHCRGKRVLNV